MTTRLTALGSLLAGSTVGVVLLVVDAPFWAFFLSSLGALPLLFWYLESRRRNTGTHSSDHEPTGLTPFPSYLSTPPSFVSFGEILPADPYVSVMTPESLYVVSNPDERESLRINTLHRLGLKTVIVTDREGAPTAIKRASPGLVSKIYGTDVLIGVQGQIGGEHTNPTTLRGVWHREPQAPSPDTSPLGDAAIDR